MYALTFDEEVPVVPSAPNRADVTCFVGFVNKRSGSLPSTVDAWLGERGWRAHPYRREGWETLFDVPVPVESWEAFHRLYEWESRPLDLPGHSAVTYLGAAVRTFFAQGGRRCYIVRVGDAWAPAQRVAKRDDMLRALIPGYPVAISSSPVDQTTWKGVGHLFGLPEVSFVCLPDLPDIIAAEPTQVAPVREILGIEERFTECSSNETPPPAETPAAQRVRAPRCDQEAYDRWADAVELVTSLLRLQRREVQFVAAVPMPMQGSVEEGMFATVIKKLIDRRIAGSNPAKLDASFPRGMASAFLQLAYPWARSPGSAALPEGLESPDAVVAGVLARNAITRGTFRSAAGLPLADVFDVYPLLRPDHLRSTQLSRFERFATAFEERVSVLGPSPAGLRLLSDVTASPVESYRPASVQRLVTVIVRAARRFGEEITFDVSGETLWARVRNVLRVLLTGLLQAGALRGASASEAFLVRCDRTTMTQSDIDAGRLIADVVFDAAAPIDRIRVILSLDDTGQLSLSPGAVATELA